MHSANLLIPADLALSAARETAERVRWREFDCQLLHFCVAAMIRTHCRATILPSLRPSCDFSIVFYWRSGNVGQKNPSQYVKFYMHCHNLAAPQQTLIVFYGHVCSWRSCLICASHKKHIRKDCRRHKTQYMPARHPCSQHMAARPFVAFLCNR